MVSITSKKTDSPVVKVEETKPNVKQTPTLTGRQLLTRYINNEYESEIAYRKVCNALEILDRMDPQGRAQFIEQLVDTSDLMDSKCGVLVSNLVNIPWSCIPEESFEKFQKLVGEIAVRHVCHTDTIYNAVVNNLLPKIAEENGEKTAALGDKPLHLYTAAHRLLAHIMKCFPMSSKTLMSSLRRHFPHFSKPSPIFNGYIRNLMQIGEYAPHLFADIWDLVFDNAVIADAHLAQREGCFDTTSIFRMENEEKMEEEESTKKDEGYTRLDMFNADVFSYLAMKHGHVPISTLNLIRLGSHVSSEDIFQCFLSILENRLLMSANVRYTSFVFLYLTSLNQSYPQRLIEFLWGIVSRPQRTQADTKKAHGAANYLAAFIARAKGIKLESAFVWLKVIFNWLVQYVDNVSSLTTYAGGLRHGLFYALCQAFFIIFSFRYKDLVKSGDMEDVRRWGLGRIVHCSLEPLKYVSRPVGLCFGAISRSLQLVYVNHVLRNDPSSSKPFEAAFPLDCYGLHTSEHLIGPLMRKFSPLAEDVSHLTSVLQDVSRVEEAPDSGMDFLDEEDLLVEVGGQQIPSSQLFTVYSSSPGLRHFESVIH